MSDHGGQDVDSAFQAAADYLAGLASSASNPLPAAALLQFYGLYKQATVGDCSADKPSIFNPSARAKWSAWKQLEGMPSSSAQQEYVTLLRQLQPQWDPQAAKHSGAKQGIGGPVFSSLAAAEDDGSQGDAAVSPLHAAASAGDAAEVQRLLAGCAAGGAVNERDSEGCSALHWAADKGHTEVLLALVQHGADVNAQDHEGLTPLQYAALSEQRAAAELLLQHGADPTIKSAEGETAKDIAPESWSCLLGSST